MTSVARLSIAVLAALAVFAAVLAWAAPSSPPLSPALELLRTNLHLDEDDLAALGRGDVAVGMLPKPGEREFAVRGVAKLEASPDRWNASWDGILFLKKTSPDFMGTGPLRMPPVLEDLAAVELNPEIARQLRKCEPQRCIYNLSLDAIHRFQRAVAAGGEDILPPVSSLFRTLLLETASAYLEKGDASLADLANRKRVVTTSDAPELLLSRRPSLAALAPGLESHFRAWKASAPRTDRDYFYWSRDKVWKREVITLVHGAFEEESGPSLRRRVLVEKTFYANHYFRGVLSVTGVVEDASGAYLFFVNRTETDNGSAFNFIERALAGHLVKRRLSRQLKAMRAGLTNAAPAEEPAASGE
jgi:hypothetical protein